jgi:hypothetical protein
MEAENRHIHRVNVEAENRLILRVNVEALEETHPPGQRGG